MSTKQELILDIQNLLNSYDGLAPTSIDPNLLEFMNKETLISIISSLLEQKENSKETDLQWLEQFKSQSGVN